MIEQVYNLFKDKIKAIYQVGSSVIPFLQDISKDLDYAILLKEKKDYKEIKEKLRELGVLTNASVFFILDSDDITLTAYSFQNHYQQKLFGNSEHKRYSIEVLEHKEEYYNLLKQYIEIELMRRKKTLYYYVMGMYILKNNSYDFTEEQINNIRETHNLNISDKVIEELREFFDLKVDYNNTQENLLTEKDKQIIEIKNSINILKQNLSNTDYLAIKYSEGELSEEEYLPIREERRNWRKQINELEEEINSIK